MDRHKKKDKISRKSRKKLKFMIVLVLVAAFFIQLNAVDTRLRDSTLAEESSMYSMSLRGDTLDIELFGNKYYLDKSEIDKFLKNLKGTAKRIKDQSALVF